ncbi:hypothetical protein PATA110616_16270 [Paenibacillus tarimensis]
MPAVITKQEDGYPEQRISVQPEALYPVSLHIVRYGMILLKLLRQTAQIHYPDRGHQLLKHSLMRFAYLLIYNLRAQRLVPRKQLLQGPVQTLNVRSTCYPECDLLHIRAGIRVQSLMEKQPLLQRGQPV